MNQLIERAGKHWGAIAIVLASLPAAARVTAQRVRDWVRRGKLRAEKLAGKGRGILVVALEDVLEVERSTRQTTAKRGGTKRGTRKNATPTLA